jgi:threonine synthase
VLYGFQAEGAAPLVSGEPVANPETVASAIRIGNPARWEEAMAAFTASRGRVAAVADQQILDAYRWLADAEGVFCEPASAASVAGLLAHGLPVVEGTAPPESVVCVLTGHGLKDTAAVDVLAAAATTVEPSVDAILAEVSR